MNKQLITLVGGLVTAVVLILGVVLGVMPLVGGVFTAQDQQKQVADTNAVYEMEIATLQKQQESIAETEKSVATLTTQIPAAAELDGVFERISRAASAAGVDVVSATKGETTPYAARLGTDEDAAAAPAPTETADAATDTTDAAADVAGAASDATSADASAADPATAPASDDRMQVAISIQVIAPDIESAQKFLDGLRAGPRAIAFDDVTVTESTDGFDVSVEALAFIRTQGGD